MQSIESVHLPSSLFRRLGALLYDAMLVLAILFFATAILMPFRGGQAFQPSDWGYSVYLMLVVMFFFGWFWTRDGQTLGMRAWKIRLTTEAGGLIDWKQAALRFVPGFLCVILFKLGATLVPWGTRWIAWLCLGLFLLDFFWAILDNQKRCLHDLLASTRMSHIHATNLPAKTAHSTTYSSQ